MTTKHTGLALTPLLRVTLIAVLTCLPQIVLAEPADRDQPVRIKASTSFSDDRSKTQIYQGNVVLTQGTRQILTDKLEVKEDPDGYYHGVATGGAGGLARFREKQEGRNDYIEGEAERIEFDTRSEKAKLFERAHIKKSDGDVRGRYIERDGYTETFRVTNGPNGTSVTGGEQTEVVLQPKPKTATKNANKDSSKP